MQPTNPFGQRETDLHYYWRQMRKRPWLIIAPLLVCAVASAVLSARTRPLYQATASLLIERDASKVVPFERLVTGNDASGYYQTQKKILQSRSLARRVIDTLRLQQHPEFAPDRSGPTWWHTVTSWPRARLAPLFTREQKPPETAAANARHDPLSGLINGFLRRLKVESARETHLIDVSFQAHDPQLAAEVANTLARLYIDLNLELRFASLQDGIEWLNKRVANLRSEAEAGELSVEKYKAANNIYSVDDRLPGVMQELETLNGALLEVRAERIRLETLYNEILTASKRPEAQAGLLIEKSIPHIEALKTSYAELQDKAVQWGNKFGERHPRLVELRTQIDAVKEKINREVEKEVQHLVQAARGTYEAAKARETSLLTKVNTLKSEAQQLNTKAIGYNQLKRDSERSKRLADTLATHLKEMNISMEVKSGDNVRIIDLAEVPRAPINIHPLRNLLLGSILGLMLGVGLVIFLDYLDRTLKTPEDAEQCLGLPVVGVISRFRNIRDGRGDVPLALPTVRAPRSHEAEAFRKLRTSLLLGYLDTPRKVFLVTSVHPHEGKTTVAANLAVVMGQMERRVLLVDGDLHNPSLNKLFQLDKESDSPGLSKLLLTEKYEDTLRECDSNLTIVLAGELPPNPSELLSSQRMQRFIAFARNQYDTVIIDSPPIQAVSDAMILSRLADGVLVVLRAGVTPRDHARRAIAQLAVLQAEAAGPNEAGIGPRQSVELVMNFLNPRDQDSYGYYGYHSYYHHQSK
jgi:capsular exopolysaccharide synthesis family protein